MIFSTLIPNFFFKVSNDKEQNNYINLTLKKSSSTMFINSLNNKTVIDKNLLLLALYLQKTSNLLNILNSNYLLDVNLPKNILLNLNIIPNYNKNFLIILYLSTKNNCNNEYNYSFSLAKKEQIFNLNYNLSRSYLNIVSSKIDLLSIFRSNFKSQKIMSGNIGKNLNLAKQNR
jgi:hypothetical protein